jgi:hypothetical protein
MCTCRYVHLTIKRPYEARYTKPTALKASAAHKCCIKCKETVGKSAVHNCCAHERTCTACFFAHIIMKRAQGALRMFARIELFHFWILEQSSTEKAGIPPTYHEPFQEVVTSPLPTPLGAEQTWFYSTAASTHVGSGRAPLRSRRTVSPPQATSHRLHLTGMSSRVPPRIHTRTLQRVPLNTRYILYSRACSTVSA